jgi:ribosomal protein S18 acetylase RimI-like enzyme
MRKQKPIKAIQDMDRAILVMRSAGRWLKESGKNPSKWWQLQNLNRQFLLQYAKPEEFYVALVGGKEAAAVVLQLAQNAQDWQRIDQDQAQPALYIHWLCVHRKFAGMGLPQMIIDFAAKKAQEKKIRLLRADTNAGEAKLRKIYEDLGFKLLAIIKEDYRQTALYQKRIDLK